MVAALAASLALAGACGGNDGTAGPAGQGAGAETEIAIKGLAFDPGSITVQAGTTVAWVNEDDVAHTVTSGSQGVQAAPGVDEGKPPRPDGLFDLALEGAGDGVTFAFDEPGTYTYFCDIHRQMTGEVVVE